MESSKLVSRSASLMMTRVYSRNAGSKSSRSSSCAAPRKPPSGFLISCASWRTIRRLPPNCASSAFSRVRRRCCVMSSISSSSRRLCRPMRHLSHRAVENAVDAARAPARRARAARRLRRPRARARTAAASSRRRASDSVIGGPALDWSTSPSKVCAAAFKYVTRSR